MYCPNCGKEIPDGSKFCPYCGAKVVASPEQKKLVKEMRGKRGRKKNSLLILIPIVAVVILLSIFLYLKFFPVVNPEASVEHNNKGISLAEEIVREDPTSINKNIPVMISEFKKAVRLDPKNISARKNLIYSYLFSDDLKNAQKETEELLKVDPQNEFAVKMKELLSEETP